MTKIAIVGEAWGEQEETQRSPFVGPSGYQLTKMIEEAGFHRAECFLTNVFNIRPRPTNDVENLFTKEKHPHLPPYRFPSGNKYLLPAYVPEVSRVIKELSELRPNIAILLGNTATWALLHSTGISKIRGTVVEALAVRGLKCLPTYHPSAILREWSLRPVTILDLAKAKRESEFPDIRRPERTVYIEPSLTDLEWYYDRHLHQAKEISIDIETAGNQITCIGFAPDSRSALVVPFVDPRREGSSYWPSTADEDRAWRFVRRVCQHPAAKIFQNGMYDLHFLWRSYGIIVANCVDDTMLLHHSLQPESEKGLGFLGSVYTNEASWKMMRSRGKTTIKRDN